MRLMGLLISMVSPLALRMGVRNKQANQNNASLWPVWLKDGKGYMPGQSNISWEFFYMAPQIKKAFPP